MPREQLQELVHDVRRLLAAGSSAAADDAGLGRRGQAMRTLAGKVPALVAVADAIDRTRQAPGNRAAAPLCDLLGVARQLSASLAATGCEGKATPVEASGPWQTASAVREVEAIAAKTFDRYAENDKDLQKVMSRPDFADLRLLPRLLRKLNAPYGGNGKDALSDVALPAYGSAVLPDLLKGLDFKSGIVSARRLRAIAHLDPRQGTDLCRKAAIEGTPAVRVAALGVLGRTSPKDAEKSAIDFLGGSSAWELALASVEILALARSDAALDALVKALTHSHETVARTAVVKLGRMKHKRAGQELLKALESTLTEWEKLPPAKGKVAASATANRETAIDRIQVLLGALGTRREAAAVSVITPLLAHQETALREAALQALARIGDPVGLAAAVELIDDGKVWRSALLAAWELPTAERFDRLAPFVELPGKTKKADKQRIEAIFNFFEWEMNGQLEEDGAVEDDEGGERLPRPARTDWDPRWAPLLRMHLTGPHRPEVAIALAVVLREKAVQELLPLLAPSVKKNECGIVEALGFLRAREAIAAMISLMSGQTAIHYCIHDALRKINDLAAVPLLEQLVEKTKDSYRRHAIGEVIEDLRKQRGA